MLKSLTINAQIHAIMLLKSISMIYINSIFIISKVKQASVLQIVRLKSLLVNEERAKESAKAKARKFEDELMIERRRCTEFSAVFERAKKVSFFYGLTSFFSS